MFQSLPGVQKPVGLQETFRSLFKLEQVHISAAHIVVDPSVELLSQAFFILFFQRIFVNPQGIYIHFILYQIVSFFLLSLDCRLLLKQVQIFIELLKLLVGQIIDFFKHRQNKF